MSPTDYSLRNRIRRLSLSIIAFCFTGCLLPQGECLAAEPVRIMSYNIRYMNTRDGEDIWANRKSAVIATVSQADVVGMQEVVLMQLEDVRGETPAMKWYGVGRDDGQQAGEMTAIGWQEAKFKLVDSGTFWLSPTPDKPSQGWDAALKRIASWVKLENASTGPFIVVNAHFDHVGKEARLQSARQLRGWCNEQKEACPVILVGDLNARLEAPPLKALLDASATNETENGGTTQPLIDARQISRTPDAGPNSTWNGFKEIVPEQRIDHILVLGVAGVAKFETLNPKTEADRFASDHLPIVADIEIPPKSAN